MRIALPLVAATALLAGCGGTPSPDRPSTADVTRVARAAGAELEHPPEAGAGVHTTERVEYGSNPPASGQHAPVWSQDGTYAGLEAPETGEVVHAQEHGRIVIQYRRGLPAAQVAQLERLYEEKPYHVLLVENATEMPCDVAASAWGHVLRCRRLTPAAVDAIRVFRDSYVDHGPEQIP